MLIVALVIIFLAIINLFTIHGSHQFSLFLLLPLLAFTWEWHALWKGRHGWQARLSPSGFSTRAGHGPAALQPWRHDEEIDLRKTATNTYQFTIRQNLQVPVHLELQCTDTQAQSLQTQMQTLLQCHIGLER